MGEERGAKAEDRIQKGEGLFCLRRPAFPLSPSRQCPRGPQT